MTTAFVDLSHNGTSWVLKVIPAETTDGVDIPISDTQKAELESVGVEVYAD